MFELSNCLFTPSNKNEDYHKFDWDTRDITFSEDDILKGLKDELTAVMKNEEKKENCYRYLPD